MNSITLWTGQTLTSSGVGPGGTLESRNASWSSRRPGGRLSSWSSRRRGGRLSSRHNRGEHVTGSALTRSSDDVSCGSYRGRLR